MSNETNKEKAMQLQAIKEDLEDLVQKCQDVLEGTGIIKKTASAYWLGYLENMLTDENSYNQTIDDTIRELSSKGEP